MRFRNQRVVSCDNQVVARLLHVIPFEVNDIHEVSKFLYTPVHGQAQKTRWPLHITLQTKGHLTCYRRVLQQSKLLDGSTKYVCFQES